MGLLRKENKKVYYIPNDSIEEKLLYDFTLEIGDTIKGYLQDICNWKDQSYTVVKDVRDSIFSNGHTFKVWELELKDNTTNNYLSGNFYIIEGIGSDIEFFNVLNVAEDYKGLNLNVFNTLRCFEIDSFQLFTYLICDGWTDKTGNISYNENIIYPNPASEQLSLLIPSGNKTLFLYDINGHLVLESINPTSKIDISHLNEGLYFVKIKTKDKTYLNKLIKL